MRMRRNPLSPMRLVTLLFSAMLVLAACAQPSGNEGDVVDQGYTSGDGSVRQWTPQERGESVSLVGADFEGNPIDTSQWRGDVVVINTWYAACPPCRSEAPALVEVATQYEGRVHLLGLNSTDEAATAQAFQRTFEVPYPSLADSDGSATATLQGVVPIQAVPTTIVLDRQGRVAARVLGEISKGTLTALIDEVSEEDTQDSAAPEATGTAEQTQPTQPAGTAEQTQSSGSAAQSTGSNT